MNIKYLSAITLFFAINSPFLANAVFNVPTDVKVTVQHDFSNLAEQLGGTSKNTMQSVLTGIMQGLAGATKSSEFNNAISDFFNTLFRETSGKFAEAINDKEFQDNIEKTTGALGTTTKKAIKQINKELSDEELHQDLQDTSTEAAKNIGIVTEEFAKGLEEKVFPQINRMSNGAISSIFNLQNSLQFGVPLAVGIALPLVGLYGSRVFWNVLEKKLLTPKPQILLPGSKYGRWDRISRWRSGYKSPEMIANQEVKDRLIEIKEKTKNICYNIKRGKKTTFDNLLIYGEPGTGKTLFAQIVADETDMDLLCVTAASFLQSGVEGIKHFDELLAMANRSKYGVIIFVDEADALFISRDTLNPESDHYKVLNHILALTGTGSNKFMLIAATNHAYVMDQAMGRRFQDRVLMPLPDATTRKELIDLYSKQVLFDIKENGKEFVEAAEKLLTPRVLDKIVDQINGLSHAEIKDMVVAMHKKACATKTGMITTRHVESAVQEAIEKKQALEEDKKQLEEKNKKN